MAKPSPNDPPRSLVHALAGVWPATAIDLTMTASAFASPSRSRSTVAIVTSITEPTDGSEARAGESAARTLNVLAGAWDRNGQPTATQTRTVEVPAAPGQTAGPGRTFQVASRLELPRGSHDLRVAVEDPATGKKGSVYTTVEIPNFERDDLSLSGLVVGAAPSAPLAPSDAFGDLLPIVPTAQREFTRTSRVAAFVRAYQGGNDSPGSVTMTARLVGVSNEPIFDETTTLAAAKFVASRNADYLIEIPVAGLPPGPFLLTLTGTLGNKKVERHLRFEMK
jgi:hypothetical protein